MVGDVPSTGEYLRIWWCFAWRFTVGSFVIGAIIGFVLVFVGTLMHLPLMEQFERNAQLIGFAISMFWGFCVLFMVLAKRYRGFRIVVVRGELPLCRME